MLHTYAHAHTRTHAHTHTHAHTVHSQALTHILQVVAAPLMRMLERELERNRQTIDKLKNKKDELVTALQELDSASQTV